MSEEGTWMFLSDYHIHSSFSYDSRQTVAQIAQAAMEKGMEEIAITDHVELAAPKLRGGKAELREAVKEIEQVGACFQGKLIIRKGMELGNANLEPEEAMDWCRKRRSAICRFKRNSNGGNLIWILKQGRSQA